MSSIKFRSQEEKNSLIESYIKSNLSQVAWAKENNIPISTLSNWIRKYKNTNQSVKFVEVTETQVPKKPMMPPLDNGATLKVNASQTTVLVEVGLCKIYLPDQMAPSTDYYSDERR